MKHWSRNSPLLWNPEIRYAYRVHKIPPLSPVLSQLSPVHIHASVYLRSVLMLPSRLGLGLPSGPFMTITFYEFLFIHMWYISRISHPPLFYHPNNIYWRVQIMKLLISVLSTPHPPLIHLSCFEILSSAPRSRTPTIRILPLGWEMI
jgi:hypothetical protein